MVENSDSFYNQQVPESIPFTLKLIRFFIKLLGFISKKLAGKYLVGLFIKPRVSKDYTIRKYEKEGLFNRGEGFYQSIEGEEIFVYIEGTPQVLLVYGWESSVRRFSTIIAALREHDIGFLAFDQPASGYSTGTTNHAILTADVIRELIHKYDSIHSIIGHSFGGGTAFLALEDSSNVKKLVTVATPTRYQSVLKPFFVLLDISPEIQEEFLIQISQHVGRDFTEYDLAQLDTHDEVQFLIIHDQNDETIPFEDAIRFHEAFPGRSELYTTEGLGHRKVMHEQVVVQKILDFIDNLPANSGDD